MAFTKSTEVDRVEVLGNGVIQVRWATIVFEDGTEIMRRNHRRVYEVAQDMSTEPNILQNVATAVWVPAIKDKRLAELNALSLQNDPNGPQWASMEDYHAGITI